MEKLPAQVGRLWVREGFALFRKQPTEMSILFICYFLLMLVIGLIPWLGQFLPLMLVPTLSFAFMQACANIEQGERVTPKLLFATFRSPALVPLLKLGGLYLLAATLAVAASRLLDGGLFWNIISGQIQPDEQMIKDSNLGWTMLFSAALYTPAAMAFWYAAPLIVWQNMSLGKALFYSFFAVYRNGKAFLLYGLKWAVIGILLPTFISALLTQFLDPIAVMFVVLLPMSVVLTVVMYCSFYPTYTSVFGKPYGAPATPKDELIT